MNHVFALVWNASMGCWTVTHEHSKRCRKSTRRMGKLALPALLLPLIFDSTAQADCTPANPGPTAAVTCTSETTITQDNAFSSAYTGIITLNSGSLVLATNAALGAGQLQVSRTSTLRTSVIDVVLNNNVGLDANLNVYGDYSLGLNGVVYGAGQLLKSGTGNLTLAGINSFAGGVSLGGGTLTLTNSNSMGTGALTAIRTSTLTNTQAVALANSLNVNGTLTLNTPNALTLGGQINGSGNLIKDGLDELVVVGNNSFSGTLNILRGAVTTLGGTALGNLSSANINSAAALNLNGNTSIGSLTGTGTSNIALGSTLSLGGNNLDNVFAGSLNGDGALSKVGTGVLELGGSSSLTGNNQVSAGTLKVSGTLGGGHLSVNAGGTLAGTGTIAGPVTVQNGGHLAGTSGSTLNMGGLTLAANSITDVAFGSPVTASTPVFSVGGNLVLDGTLNISDAGGFGNGVYRLFNYGGSLTNNLMALGTLPAGLNPGELNLQTAIANQVNLLVNSPNLIVQFWDGSAGFPDGMVQGGNGTWNSGGTNWTDLNGNINSNWYGQFAVFQGAAGNVRVDGAKILGGMQFMTDGYALNAGTAGVISAVNGNSGTFAVRLDPGVTASIDVAINGPATLNKLDTGTLVLNGANAYTGGTLLSGGTLVVGSDSALGTGTLSAAAGTTLDSNKAVTLLNDTSLSGLLSVGGSNALTLNGVISGSGSLAKNGAGTLSLGGNNSYRGPTALNAGALVLTSGSALGMGALNVANGTQLDNSGAFNLGNTVNLLGNLTVLGSNDLALSGQVNGVGGLTKQGAAKLILNGSNNFTGNTEVNGGTLQLLGSLKSAQVNVNNTGTLAGSGTLNGALTVNSGGHLSLSSGTTLSVGSLTMSSGSNFDAALGAPSTQALLSTGNLTLDGNLNVTDAGSFGAGVYRLINYTGSLVDLGLDVASAPSGFGLGDLQVQTGALGQVNLVVNTPDLGMRFWDGSNAVANGVVDGGAGTWTAGGGNWTSVNGNVNKSWADDFAVFQGTAGSVTVEGPQLFNGMQFLTNGYRLEQGAGGKLTAVNRLDGYTLMRVDPNVTATLDVAIDGTGTLNKVDSGTLVLNGANSYTGGTLLNGGTLVVGNDSALGSGALSTAAGTTLDSNRAVTLANAMGLNGNLTLAGSHALTLNGGIVGSAGLVKNGLATLALGGNNSFVGPVALNAGGLVLGSNRALGAGDLNAAGGTTLDASKAVSIGNTVNLAGNLGIAGSAGINLAGVVGGAGGLTKNGQANLELSGNNTYQGGTTLNAGTLTLGSATALGQGSLTVAGAASLDSSSAQVSSNAIGLNANLTVAGSNDLTLDGAISGNAGLAKNGNANLTLNGANSYQGGTTLNAGSLTLGQAGALGSGALTVSGASNLNATGPLVLANNLNVNAGLTVASTHDLTLAGVLAGNGSLTKTGLADLTLSGNNSFNGQFNVLVGSLNTLGETALGSNAQVNLGYGSQLNLGGSTHIANLTGNGNANVAAGTTLNLGATDLSSTFAGALGGAGQLNKLGNGTFILSGNSALSGDTLVNGGTLTVNGSLASGNVIVNNGGTLNGGGNLIGAVSVANGGHLGLSTGSTLSAGSLVLAQNANLDVALGTPVAGGGTALLNVAGNLTLDGTLNVTDQGVFGAGVYRLANYGGNLTDNGLNIGTLPGGTAAGDLTVQTVVGNQVNLLVATANTTVQFWDGGQLAGNGSIDGGNGTWASGVTNWANVDGSYNQHWVNQFAVFQGAAGNVSVNGVQSITGLQFASDGYRLLSGVAGSLNLVNGTASVRVDPNSTATLDLAINGNGTLNKLDSGTLVLNGANGYTGGTLLNGGSLVLGNAGALGSGTLTSAAGTTLDNRVALTLNNDVLLNGGLTLAGSNDLVLAGNIAGSGGLTKQGASNLTLSGSNSFGGALDVLAGSLTTVGGAALGSGTGVNLASGASLNIGNSLTLASLTGNGSTQIAAPAVLSVGSNGLASNFAGALSGAGQLNKVGNGVLTLGGNNTLSGDTRVAAGTLNVAGSLASASVAVDNGATLTGNGSLAGAVNVADGGNLNLNAGNTLSVGSLVLGQNANLNVGLGAPALGGGSSLLNVGGNLTLDGKLNIADLGGFGTGVYRLANYAGNLTNNGLAIGTLPGNLTAADMQVQTAVGNQVNLLVQAPNTTVQFWDGSNAQSNGAINGGAGTWSTGASNWTSVDGVFNQAWGNSFAVFQGTGGQVGVEGAQRIGGMQFAGNGYQLVAGNAGSLTLVNGTTGNTAVRVDPNVTATLDVALNGSGTLNKLDSGTLVLNGVNSYSGGTLLNGGTLVVGNSGALGSGSLTAADGTRLDNSSVLALNNAVVLNGGLTLAGSHDLTLAGAISGTGSLLKQGSSALTLSGDNSFSGALNIQGGKLTLDGINALGNATLIIGSAGSVGMSGATTLDVLGGTGHMNLVAGSALQVGANHSGSVYDGNLSGRGSLNKIGNGKLVLNGQSSVGDTHVTTGSLIVGGAAGSTASLASNVQVDNGAMLGGHGLIDGNISLASGAKLNPGNSIGTLRVDGNVNLTPGSILEIEANPDGTSDKLIATGTVSLGGARLNVLAGAGSWAPDNRYGIIQAAAVNGTFAEITSNLAFLTPNVAYSATGVELQLQRNDVSFASAGTTSNQRAVATAVDAGGKGALYNAVSSLSVAQARAAFDNLSGEVHASTQGALFDDSRHVRDGISQRLQAAQGRAPADGVLHSDADSGMTFWMQGYGGWGDSAGNSNAAKAEHNSSGTLLGIDLPLNEHWRVGVAAGYGSNKLDVDARNSSSDIDSTSLTLYAAGQWDAINLRLGASHAWNDIDSSRRVSFDGIADHDKANYDAKTTQVFGELGYAVKAGEFTVEPYVGLARVKVDSDSFNEKGGATALRGDSQNDSVTYSTLGVHASTPLAKVAGVPVSLQGTLGWQHAFDDLDTERQMAFAGGNNFTVQGTPLAKDSAVAQLGVKAQVAAGTTVELGYAGQFGDGYKDNGVRLGLNVSF
ncbi:autotransporter-associated beta strand repeat-containing protein [Pseudomonas fontis]|uniref:Autotransporter-associated beta strand repeat-containing protein n=1 Tax=Pseudomonas fontis TaxID=2942633 RepID=A0ABT5NV57_9PSED|nr:autotransporter-associated beta strand repeat-containing protein [Pseudomonas fontis]MDD0974184.1 autotransporter-associated beta strand repeat-containing protein [Pseudomonas fontis]MDD0992064.1 autotransporter-associated beta strand repeat-containing protein [Pseudomonas fontis]